MAQRVADIPTWLGGYEKMMASPKEGRTDEEHESRAIALADQFVLDSQGGGTTKDLALIQRGGAVAKLFMTFYSYGNMILNATAREARRTNFRSPASVGEFMGNLSLLYVIPALATVAMGHALGKMGGDGDDDWQSWLTDVGQEMGATALNGIVLARELTGLMRDGNRGYEGPAGTRLVQLVYKLGKEVEQGKLDESLWHAATATAGALFRVPAMQAQRTIDGWVALHEGRTHDPGVLLVGPSQAARAAK